MTKKRFIKLLMGKFRYPRNKARLFANNGGNKWNSITKF